MYLSNIYQYLQNIKRFVNNYISDDLSLVMVKYIEGPPYKEIYLFPVGHIGAPQQARPVVMMVVLMPPVTIKVKYIRLLMSKVIMCLSPQVLHNQKRETTLR